MKPMRTRSIMLFVAALALGGLTAILARSWLAQHAVMAQAAPILRPAMPSKSILVARRAIARGQILRPNDFAWQPWPANGIDNRYIVQGTRASSAFTGWVARHPITPGTPVTLAEIIAPGDRGFLAAVLRPGMRAISVPVTATSGIAGFIFPGDHVDLLITLAVPDRGHGDNKEAQFVHKACETVLRNVRVLAIDQRLQGKEGEAIVAHTATLEVTPKETEVIAVASEMGKLSLSLRSLVASSSDRQHTDSTNGVASSSFTLDSEVSKLLPKAFIQKGDSDSSEVTILRGGQKARETAVSQTASRGI
jgi:pilus assembly protein CpaB